MNLETIHIHKSSLKSHSHLVFLFIPAIIFVAVLVFIASKAQTKFAAVSESSDVLGTQIENLK